MLRIWRKNSLKRVLSFSREYCVYFDILEKDPQNSKSEESSENRETFPVSKFSPATGVRILLRILKS